MCRWKYFIEMKTKRYEKFSLRTLKAKVLFVWIQMKLLNNLKLSSERLEKLEVKMCVLEKFEIWVSRSHSNCMNLPSSVLNQHLILFWLPTKCGNYLADEKISNKMIKTSNLLTLAIKFHTGKLILIEKY